MNALDRDAARDVIDAYYGVTHADVLDLLEGCVRPAPAQAIDRDAVARAVAELRAEEVLGKALRTDQEWADRVLALLRPVDGVTLTRDEAVRVLTWRNRPGFPYDADDDALAGRLEAAQ